MKNEKLKIVVAIMLIVSLFCTSCANSKLFPTQKMIDNIIPDYNLRMYTVADLIPYKFKEIKNAQALYGMELTDFFYENTATEAEAKRITQKEKNDFYKELRCRNHNYKIIKKRFAMYVDGENDVEGTQAALRDKEYEDYYKVETAHSANVIKQFNNGKLDGMPLMSIRADMTTATQSDATEIYSEVDCEIYEPVTMSLKQYDSLKFGDTVKLNVPATNSTIYCSEKIEKTCTYVATDSLLYKDDEGNDAYYFIADVDGIQNCRRILDESGKTLETFVQKTPLQFMKLARVAEANEPQRLMSSVAQDDLVEYNFDDLVEKALCGGYLVYKYKDYIYANSITTNLKGYITSVTNYTNQRIDNEYYNSLNK